MANLILHIGMAKTGSSALNSFLLANSEKLLEQGFSYPAFPEAASLIPLGRNGKGLFDKADLDSGFIELQAGQRRILESYLEKLGALAKDVGTVILRDELGWGWQRDWAGLIGCARRLGFERISVIVYLRRPDQHLGSVWKEGAGTSAAPPSLEDLIEFRTKHRSYYSYDRGLKCLEAVFPKEDITVRSYSRSSLKRSGGLFRDYCAAAGIAWDEGFRFPSKGTNESYSYDVAEALFRLRTESRFKFICRGPLAKKTMELTAAEPDPPGMSPFTPDEARNFTAIFADSTKEVSERYFGGEPFFDDDYDYPAWVPNEERIARYMRQLRPYARLTSFLLRIYAPVKPLYNRFRVMGFRDQPSGEHS